MTVPQTHKNAEQHRGLIPADQIASGAGTFGNVPVDQGDNTVVWTEPTGGGSACDHQHQTERFVALGDTPETFTIGFAPLWGVRVHVQGLRADPSDVTLTGMDVSLDTSTDDVVVIDYERECAGPAGGGVIYDGHPEDESSYINWYYVMSEADFNALTPGAWAPDTFYIPGALIAEDSSYFIRSPNRYPSGRMSDSIGNEPNWTVPSEGDTIADLNGYWMRLPDGWLPSDPVPAWAADTSLTYPILGGATAAYIIAVDGFVYVADVGYQTGSSQPDFPQDPCAGLDTFLVGDAWGDPAFPIGLARPYVALSVTLTRNGSPETVTETTPDEAMVEIDTSTWAFADVLVFSYEAVC